MEIWLYDVKDRVIISDIDGTITKSDVIGYFLPSIGIKWHFEGIVPLYRELERLGYKIVYLTARSMTEIDSTRKYL